MAARKKSRIVQTQTEVAVHFGVSNKSVQEWFARGCPHKKRRKGVPGEYDIDAIDEWRREQKGIGDTDPMLEGPSSANLERYRLARAKIVELELRVKKKQLLSKDTIIQGLAVFASTMRQAFDTLQRQYGQDALAIISKALDDSERIFLRAIGTEDVDIDTDDSTCSKPDISDSLGATEAQADCSRMDSRVSDDEAAEGTDAP